MNGNMPLDGDRVASGSVQEQTGAGNFRLRKCTFRGNGLHPQIQEGVWADLCQRVHEQCEHSPDPTPGMDTMPP